MKKYIAIFSINLVFGTVLGFFLKIFQKEQFSLSLLININMFNGNTHTKDMGDTKFSQAVHFQASALWADAFYKSKCPSV